MCHSGIKSTAEVITDCSPDFIHADVHTSFKFLLSSVFVQRPEEAELELCDIPILSTTKVMPTTTNDTIKLLKKGKHQ